MWIFENLCNWGAGGSKKFEKSSKGQAEDLAHDQLRGWYKSSNETKSAFGEGSIMEYFNNGGQIVGRVYKKI